jgi:hypothetical protein
MHWLLNTFPGFMLIYGATLLGLASFFLWITWPTKADRARWAVEVAEKEMKENIEREPKRLL